MIDGVPINPPHFNENKPLRDQPPVTNDVEGAMDIQEAMELHEWGQQSGQSPVPWARYLREAPLPGLSPKSVLILFGTGDQNAINPGTSAILRAGNLADGPSTTATISRSPRTPRFQRTRIFSSPRRPARTLWSARSRKACSAKSRRSSHPTARWSFIQNLHVSSRCLSWGRSPKT